MRNIYFMAIPVERRSDFNLYHDLVDVVAHCFYKDVDAQSAFMKASFFLRKDGWDLKGVAFPPVKVEGVKDFNDESFANAYVKAWDAGGSVVYKAKSSNVKEPVIMDAVSEKKINPSKFHQVSGKLRKRKVCYHVEAGGDCDRIIRAHSIQKSKALRLLSENGHVYRLSDKLNEDRSIEFRLMGVEKASTFQGFCKKHDNELFEPIDNYDFDFSDNQAFLYSYRSLCRELYVKENQNKLSGSMRDYFESVGHQQFRDLFSDMHLGSGNGLRGLFLTKEKYDDVWRSGEFDKVEWLAFKFEHPPNMMFSGIMYPDFDFQGRKLQDLSDLESNLRLITFCAAPSGEGWVFIFSWHEDYADICRHFVRSLALQSAGSPEAIGDILFRLVISGCENLVIAPSWWDSLDEIKKENVKTVMGTIGTPLSASYEDYLTTGLEEISEWQANVVYQKYDFIGQT